MPLLSNMMMEVILYGLDNSERQKRILHLVISVILVDNEIDIIYLILGVLFDGEDSVFVVGMTYGNLSNGIAGSSSSDAFVAKARIAQNLQSNIIIQVQFPRRSSMDQTSWNELFR
jgi:hypothetical protein